MEGGAPVAFLPAEEPLRATQDVSITLTPMLARDTKTPFYQHRTGDRLPSPPKAETFKQVLVRRRAAQA